MKSINNLSLVKTVNKLSVMKSINYLRHMKNFNNLSLVKTIIDRTYHVHVHATSADSIPPRSL